MYFIRIALWGRHMSVYVSYEYQPLCTEGRPSLICINVRWSECLFGRFVLNEAGLTYEALIA